MLNFTKTKLLKSVNGVKEECIKQAPSFFTSCDRIPSRYFAQFEGVIPIELALCLQDLISKGFFTLDRINHSIMSFRYKYSDKVNKPKIIPKAALIKHSIGGNGHETWA